MVFFGGHDDGVSSIIEHGKHSFTSHCLEWKNSFCVQSHSDVTHKKQSTPARRRPTGKDHQLVLFQPYDITKYLETDRLLY
ncbi:hypothetical protein MJO28_006679 [Puccinia striiformis f. sp. tritici]|uniref:Uncharacterized protein n=1 Tax=Puccinia striiformis f. sp. tritici TaxID=168172 RepID=A0ACC0EJD4_9BASI|nr:hypothetical protein MJO28_006679 [Puccinia striiformis f. sp. tritici]